MKVYFVQYKSNYSGEYVDWNIFNSTGIAEYYIKQAMNTKDRDYPKNRTDYRIIPYNLIEED